MNEELKNKLTERFDKIVAGECDNKDLRDALLKAYLAGGEYGYQYAIGKACEWLRNNLEYYLGDYNLAEDELEDNQVHYAAMLEELRKAMEE